MAWIAFQVASLSAFVPRECCSAHRPSAAVQQHGCHQDAAAVQCPMRSAGGAPCPMHRTADGDERSGRCSLRGSCNGPLSALFALLSNQAVLSDVSTVLPDSRAGDLALEPSENLISRFTPPDPLPPRA